MSKIVNLRTRRKQNARDKARVAGDEAAARHGEGTALRSVRQAEADRAARRLDAHRRDRDEG